MRPSLKASGLKTPRAAAVAGILFSILLLAALALLSSSAQTRVADPGAWLARQSWKVSLALNLVPFAGIAFLWFIGVLRDRLGSAEDRLFATVFLGSGLLFVGMVFSAAAVVGAILVTYAAAPADLLASSSFGLARSLARHLVAIYASKMAGVFMFTASTMILRTRFTAPWTALVGFAVATAILLGSQTFEWTLFLFPVWVFIVSTNILVEEFWQPGGGGGPAGAAHQGAGPTRPQSDA